MMSWFFSASPDDSRGRRRPSPTMRPVLELLEDRCVPSMNSMMGSTSGAPSPASPSPTPVNTVASLSHDQIHTLQDQSQLQAAIAVARLEVEQAVLGILQAFAPQVPQVRPEIASLQSVLPAQQATANVLQNQMNLLNQLDDLQDQGILLGVQIQQASSLIPTLLQIGDVQTANTLQSLIAADQAAVQALQPQITAVEVEVSVFV
jgi:hypothetical protein